MDPLSITTAIITCLQIANNLKQSVEKVSQNRRRILYLAEDVVQSLSELQSFCIDHTDDLEVSRDLKKAVKQLESQLIQVLEQCRKYCDPPRRNSGYLSKPKAYFKMWRKSDKIEEDIERLRDAIRSSISRFTLLTSARIEMVARRLASATVRTEHHLLASQTMQSIQLQQFDVLFGTMMISTSTSRPVIPSLLHTTPNEIDHDYLLLKIQTLLAKHGSLNLATLCLPPLDASNNENSMIQRELACALGKPSMHEVLNHAWSVLHFLDDLPTVQSQSTRYFFALILLGCILGRFGYSDSAVLVHSATSQFLSRWHVIPGGEAYVPYLGLSLSVLTWSLALERDDPVPDIGHKALSLLSESSYHDAPSLCGYIYALRVLVYYSSRGGQHEEALRYARQGLEVIYSANLNVIPETPTTISWVVFWGVSSDNTLPITVERDVWSTQSAGFFLYWVANVLSSLGRWDEALIAANDAINLLKALHAGYDETALKMNLLQHYVDDLVQEIPRWEVNRDINAGPPIQSI